jgi:hypothetical protein
VGQGQRLKSELEGRSTKVDEQRAAIGEVETGDGSHDAKVEARDTTDEEAVTKDGQT